MLLWVNPHNNRGKLREKRNVIVLNCKFLLFNLSNSKRYKLSKHGDKSIVTILNRYIVPLSKLWSFCRHETDVLSLKLFKCGIWIKPKFAYFIHVNVYFSLFVCRVPSVCIFWSALICEFLALAFCFCSKWDILCICIVHCAGLPSNILCPFTGKAMVLTLDQVDIPTQVIVCVTLNYHCKRLKPILVYSTDTAMGSMNYLWKILKILIHYNY